MEINKLVDFIKIFFPFLCDDVKNTFLGNNDLEKVVNV